MVYYSKQGFRLFEVRARVYFMVKVQCTDLLITVTNSYTQLPSERCFTAIFDYFHDPTLFDPGRWLSEASAITESQYYHDSR
jgi:hypothetical protein